MSMITGCPACGTMFKVVPDQLKISDGWVRCGHCSEVFDAPAHMVPNAALREAGVATEGEPHAPVPVGAPAEAPQTIPQAIESIPASHPLEEPVQVTGPDPVPQEVADALAAPAEAAPLVRESEPADLPAGEPFDQPPEVPADSPPAAPVEAAAVARVAVDDDDDIELEDVGFIRKARRRAFWARPMVRVLLLLVLLALAALLAVQVALEERDRIAAMHPQARPWLEKLCEPLGCAIRPPRRIESIAIDSSTFAKLRTDTYRLSLTLKNQAQQPVAVPAIELTLTDTQDQPVLRRVLQPQELGAPADTIASEGEWTANAAIAVSGPGSGRIAGYRLLAFYP
jgi:predicted Zn finger-like uncharacterized protein